MTASLRNSGLFPHRFLLGMMLALLPGAAAHAQVLDDQGQPISEAEIRAHERNGVNGGIIGGLLGGLLGASLELLIETGGDLSGENMEGRGEAGLIFGAAIGAGAGAVLGVHLGRVTRQEAIEKIREERRRQTTAFVEAAAPAQSNANLPQEEWYAGQEKRQEEVHQVSQRRDHLGEGKCDR
jgi:hypothetical protein